MPLSVQAGVPTTFSNTIIYDATSPEEPTTEALTAKISMSPASGPAPLSVSFSTANSTGNISSYSWDFGDGDKDTGAAVTHTYTIPGTYTTQLEVFDDIGNSALTSVTITAEPVIVEPVPPSAVISSSTAAGESPLTVTFDGSASTATNATITSYDWDFGDGAKGTTKTTSHVFTVAGTYNTKLIVTDSLGLTSSQTTPVIVTPATTENQLPIASFSATPTQGPYPLTVSFDASSSNDEDGNIATHLWNFGDGSKGTGKTVQHTYTSSAIFTATLQVTDDLGANSQPTSKTIVAEEPEDEIALNYEIGGLGLTDEWVRINFENTFNNPAVFLSPPTNNDTEAVITRLRNLDKLGFEVRLQEWDYLDGKHTQETVNYLAIEQGQTILPDGTLIDVGIFNGSSKTQTISFNQSFASPPVVLTTIVSENEKDAVTGRISNVTTTSFAYLFQEQETTKKTHVAESVAYLAWSTGSGSVDNIQFSALTPTTAVTPNVTTVPFENPFQSTPFLFTEQQTMNGGDTTALRIQKLTNENVELFLQEEQSKDSELAHKDETIGYIAISSTASEAEVLGRLITLSWEV